MSISVPEGETFGVGFPQVMRLRREPDSLPLRVEEEIPAQRVAQRISEMIAATRKSAEGREVPDWETVEAGIRLYLACTKTGTEVSPPRPESAPEDLAQFRSGFLELRNQRQFFSDSSAPVHEPSDRHPAVSQNFRTFDEMDSLRSVKVPVVLIGEVAPINRRKEFVLLWAAVVVLIGTVARLWTAAPVPVADTPGPLQTPLPMTAAGDSGGEHYQATADVSWW